ncbi:MAG: hypothetical protein R6W67_04995 [Bacteroidales bacterium]
MKRYIILLITVIVASCGSYRDKSGNSELAVQTEFSSNTDGRGQVFTIDFRAGDSFYYPMMAFWLEDMDSSYLQTLYVARSVATGVFKYGRQEGNRWVESDRRAPQALPYWSHQRGIMASDGLFMPEPGNPVPDAYTGATPVTGFVLTARADKMLQGRVRLLMEINQNWDWNQYWTNDRFPGDENYAMSAQPALVYEVILDIESNGGPYNMKPIGHSHWSGRTGELFPDFSTLTTALDITGYLTVIVSGN